MFILGFNCVGLMVLSYIYWCLHFTVATGMHRGVTIYVSCQVAVVLVGLQHV